MGKFFYAYGMQAEETDNGKLEAEGRRAQAVLLVITAVFVLAPFVLYYFLH